MPAEHSDPQSPSVHATPLWPGDEAPGHLPDKPFMPSLTPMLLEPGKPRATVIVCPGGGYHRLAPHEAEPVGSWLNSIGINALILRYRTRPYAHPWPLADGQRAVRLARHKATEWGIDPDRIGMLGFSAGGHLSASVGTLFASPDLVPAGVDDLSKNYSARPNLLLLCYPVISSGPFAHEGSFKNLLGADGDTTLRQRLSAECAVTAETPETFLWHGFDDVAVPVENAMLFASALRKHNVGCDLHVFQQAGRHGIGLGSDEPDNPAASWPQLAAAWLRQRGWTD